MSSSYFNGSDSSFDPQGYQPSFPNTASSMAATRKRSNSAPYPHRAHRQPATQIGDGDIPSLAAPPPVTTQVVQHYPWTAQPAQAQPYGLVATPALPTTQDDGTYGYWPGGNTQSGYQHYYNTSSVPALAAQPGMAGPAQSAEWGALVPSHTYAPPTYTYPHYHLGTNTNPPYTDTNWASHHGHQKDTAKDFFPVPQTAYPSQPYPPQPSSYGTGYPPPIPYPQTPHPALAGLVCAHPSISLFTHPHTKTPLVDNTALALDYLGEFTSYFGSSAADITAWQKLCYTCGVNPAQVPTRFSGCKAYLKAVFVNIFDLVDAARIGGQVDAWLRWRTADELKRYSYAQGKICPAEVGRGNELWKYCLKKWY